MNRIAGCRCADDHDSRFRVAGDHIAGPIPGAADEVAAALDSHTIQPIPQRGIARCFGADVVALNEGRSGRRPRHMDAVAIIAGDQIPASRKRRADADKRRVFDEDARLRIRGRGVAGRVSADPVAGDGGAIGRRRHHDAVICPAIDDEAADGDVARSRDEAAFKAPGAGDVHAAQLDEQRRIGPDSERIHHRAGLRISVDHRIAADARQHREWRDGFKPAAGDVE